MAFLIERAEPSQVDALCAIERQAVQLRYLEDASADEIAAALGVTPNNARQIVFVGLDRLRRLVRREWPAGRG